MTKTQTAKQWMAILVAFGFSLICGIASPRAEDLISLESVKSLYEAGGQEQTIAIVLSNGLMMGFMISNADLQGRGDDLLFCAPDKLFMNGELLCRQTLSWSVGQQSRVEMGYPVAALLALEEAFPCD